MTYSGNSNKFNLKSKFFNFHTTPREQDLVNSLIKENIHINGIDMIYIPRKFVNLDKIYGEDVLSSFEKTFELVFYVESSESYQGMHSFMGTMGPDIQDQSKLVVSRDVFNNVVVNGEDNEEYGIRKPRNGDLIYNSIMNRIFEIVNVEEFQMFYQLGKQYTYSLTVEFFDYSNEKIKTGIEEIDTKNESAIDKTFELTLENVSGPAFIVGEQVYHGVNIPTADFIGTVLSYNIPTRKLIVSSQFELPIIDTALHGEDSTALADVKEFVTINFADINKDNIQLETEADEVIIKDPEDDFYDY